MVANSLVAYRGDELPWPPPPDSIVLIAEYTTDAGPFAVDDYFLVIHSLEAEMSYRTVLSSNFEPLLRDLSKSWGTELSLALTSSTEWQSRVIWPVELQNQRYFKLTPVPSRSALEWLKSKVFGPALDLALTDEVRVYLEQERLRRSE
ncbi:hypothetical protein SAMN05421770_10394 [Granulicella rosea]|uniref:Uncharacterized protein n=1 Tax=Granulicella rosea TaxID=474952 RepID=A0A239IFE1_9BACT|nr:hypothetical protein [Granulicella rosea]SNS92486.1 hypothetical protein SAMN05421770_10394 [Granulicella rosea]